MKTILGFIAALAAALFASSAYAQDANSVVPPQTTITPYFAAGPVYGSPGFNSYLTSMAQTMMRAQTITPNSVGTPVTLMTNGQRLFVTNVFEYADGSGSSLIAGAVFKSTTPFTMSQLGPSVISEPDTTTRSNSFSSWNFSNFVIGIKWGPDGQGTGDTIYSSGSSAGVQINELVVITDSWSFNKHPWETVGETISDFFGSFGFELPITYSYSLNNASTSVTAVIYTPQPLLSLQCQNGTNMVLQATNGLAERTCFILCSTNAALPFTNWTRISTNAFDSDGNLTVTNRIKPNANQGFYVLQVQKF